MLFDQMIIMIVPTVALALVVRNHPSKPPSAAAVTKLHFRLIYDSFSNLVG